MKKKFPELKTITASVDQKSSPSSQEENIKLDKNVKFQRSREKILVFNNRRDIIFASYFSSIRLDSRKKRS